MSNIRINSIPSRYQYTYAGGSRVFVINFPFFEDTDLFVYVGDPADNYDQQDPINILTLGPDYTVTGAGLATGGTVTIDAAVTLNVNDTVTVVGRMPIDRFAIYENSSVISMAQLNEDFNRLTVMVKNIDTIIEQTMPKYDRSEVVNTDRTGIDFSYVNLPLLEANQVWIGNATSDGLTKAVLPAGGGTVGVDVTPQRVSIALWTATPNTLTDSSVWIDGNLFDPLTVGDRGGFTDDWGAMHWPAIVTGSRTGTPSNGDTYYDTTLQKFFGYENGAWVPFITGSGGETTAIKLPVNQVGHGFSVGDIVRYDAGTSLYALAQADSKENAEVRGMVVNVLDADNFTLQQIGYVDSLVGLMDGSVYFLSPTIAGGYTTTEPSGEGEVSKPLFQAVSTTEAWLDNYRGLIITDAESTGGGSTTGEPVKIPVVQVGHGFSVGEYVYNDGTDTYALAQANALTTARGVGFVVEVVDANNFFLQQSGYSDAFGGLTSPGYYYLSDATPGAITTTAPTTPGSYTKPVLQAVNATSGWILEQREKLVTGTGNSTLVQIQYTFDTTQRIIPCPAGVWTDVTGSAVSITPTDVASLIKITFNQAAATTGVSPLIIRVLRDGATPVGVGVQTGSEIEGYTWQPSNTYNNHLCVIDAPATLAAVNYKIQVYASGANTLYVNRNVPKSFAGSTTLIAEEYAP